MRAVLALAVIVLVTGVFGMSQISPVMSKTKLTKTRLVNQMGDIELLRERIKKNVTSHVWERLSQGEDLESNCGN